MSYATVANIESEFKNMSFSSSTSVTKTEVEGFLVETDAIIDSYVGAKYIIPIDSAAEKSLAILRRIEIALVAFRIASILYQRKEPVGSDRFIETDRATAQRNAMKLLEGIQKGTNELPDATKKNTNGGIADYNSQNNKEAVWEKEEDQW